VRGEPKKSRSAAWSEIQLRRGCSFFSAHWVIGAFFRKVHLAIDQGLKAWCCITQVNSNNTVVNLATIAVVLTIDTNCFWPTLGVARLVDQSNRIWM
jgi:hypothetical protein